MADFADTAAPVLDVALLEPPAAGRLSPALPAVEQLLDANLYAVCDLVAGRAARASSARQYRAIYTRFCDALRDELGRAPVVGDVTADAIAAYSREQERHGGRGGGPASPATRRVHITMLRALLAQLGLEKDAAAVRVPSHRLGPPETLTTVQYGNLIRATDKRTLVGKRDHALLRLLGDCGLRNAELRSLAARAIRRPRANSTHHHLFVRGKGDVEREIPIPAATLIALEAWLRAHPDRRGGGLRDDDVLFVSLARARNYLSARRDLPAGSRQARAALRRRRRRARSPGPSARVARLLRHDPRQRARADSGDQGQTRARLDRDDGSIPRRTPRRGEGVGAILDRHHEIERRRAR